MMCAVSLLGGRFALGHGRASYLLRRKRSPDGGDGASFGSFGGNSDGEGTPISGSCICSAQLGQAIIVHCNTSAMTLPRTWASWRESFLSSLAALSLPTAKPYISN